MITPCVDEVFGLFPIPFMRARATLPPALVAGLVELFAAQATRDNITKAPPTGLLGIGYEVLVVRSSAR